MYVNIGYTVKFEDVPKTVEKMMSEDIGASVVDGVLDKVEDSIIAIREQNIDRTIQLIDETRKNLMLIDAQLSNCFDILSGYQKEKLGVNSQPEQQPAGTDLSSLQDLQATRDQLLVRIADLKEELGQVDMENEEDASR